MTANQRKFDCDDDPPNCALAEIIGSDAGFLRRFLPKRTVKSRLDVTASFPQPYNLDRIGFVQHYYTVASLTEFSFQERVYKGSQQRRSLKGLTDFGEATGTGRDKC